MKPRLRVTPLGWCVLVALVVVICVGLGMTAHLWDPVAIQLEEAMKR